MSRKIFASLQLRDAFDSFLDDSKEASPTDKQSMKLLMREADKNSGRDVNNT